MQSLKIKHLWCFQDVAESHLGWSRVNKAERMAEDEVREGGIYRTSEFVLCTF